VCSNAHGFVPVSSLGLVGRIDADNLLLDPWGQPYRYSAQIGATYQICNVNDCPSAASIVVFFLFIWTVHCYKPVYTLITSK